MSRRARSKYAGTLAAVSALAAIGGCGGDGSGEPTGTVSVAITDAPADDADEVWVQVSGVAFKPEGGAPEVVEEFTPRPINLLEYQQGDVALLLENVPFKAERYQWLRLIVDAEPNVRDSYLMMEGQECELGVPSGAETGLKMNRGFTIPADGSLALTIDFDLHKSLRAPPGQATNACSTGYLLRPTLRLVDDADVGAVSGTVQFDSGEAPLDCLPKVYLFEGAVAPDDFEDADPQDDVDPLVTASVEMTEPGSGTYTAAFIPAGDYTAAFTCGSDTGADEELVFIPGIGAPVTVQSNLISTVDFTVPADE